MERLTETALVRDALAGDRLAFATLIDRHRPLVLALCRRTLGDHGLAEDAAQEAVLQAFLGLHRLRRAERFGPWLAGIGLNVCRRWLQVAGRGVWAYSLDLLLDGGTAIDPLAHDPDPQAVVEEKELGHVVRRAVETLPPGQRAAVLLFYLEGQTQAEVAATLGIAPNAVKARLHKARQALLVVLRTTWQEEGGKVSVETAERYVDVKVLDVRRMIPKEADQNADIASSPSSAMPVAPIQAQGTGRWRNVVLLQEVGGAGRVLPIWVGWFEGDALVVLMQKIQMPRPLTFSFAASLLLAAGGRLREVRVNRLAEATFYAQAVVDGPRGEGQAVDCRPSDAIALALATSAPIRVAEEVMEQASQDADSLAEELADVTVLRSAEIAAEMLRRQAEMKPELERASAEWRERRAARRAI